MSTRIALRLIFLLVNAEANILRDNKDQTLRCVQDAIDALKNELSRLEAINATKPSLPASTSMAARIDKASKRRMIK